VLLAFSFALAVLRAVGIFNVILPGLLPAPVTIPRWGPPPPGMWSIVITTVICVFSTAFLALLPVLPVWLLALLLKDLDSATFNLEVAASRETPPPQVIK